MTRPLRLEFPGSFWHITSRGNARQDIVRTDDDRRKFVDLLGETVERFDWILYAYALMNNHFHLLLELSQETLSSGMHWLKGRFAQEFNRRNDRVGHVFQGRFGGLLVDQESYFLEVLRYVVLNPVRAGVVDRPEDARWTSYPATAGLADPPEWLAVARVLSRFGGSTATAREQFRHFVHDGIGAKKPWTDLVGQIYLGPESWLIETKERVDVRLRSDEHPRIQRDVVPVRISDIMAAVANASGVSETSIRYGRGGAARMVAAWIAGHEEHLPLREIAAGLKIRSASRVSMLISRCERDLGSDESLRDLVERSLSLFTLWRKRKVKA